MSHFILHGDTIAAGSADSLRWRDLIIDGPHGGSVGTADARFTQRYGRGYFRYATDTAAHTLTIWRTTVAQDSIPVLLARYAVRTPTHADLWTMLGGDSLHVELTRTARRFPLAERQFHWVSEYNR